MMGNNLLDRGGHVEAQWYWDTSQSDRWHAETWNLI